MLTELGVKNFRSLEDIHVPLSPLTVLVGPNGVGKTSILRAIDTVLGDAWPSLRSFRVPQDFTNFDATREISLIVRFDPPYEHEDMLRNRCKIGSLRVSCKPYKKAGRWGQVGDLHCDTEGLDADGQIPLVALTRPSKGSRPQFGPLRVGTELRDYAKVLLIDHRRSVTQHLPSTRGSILGKLFQSARREFAQTKEFKDAYDLAMDCLRTERVKTIENTVEQTAKRMLGFLGKRGLSSVRIGFGFADPANPFNSLRLNYSESGLMLPGEELGLGIQSAMVVGIFEAYRQLDGEFATVLIEEPEMYLHPQAQRYFYRLLWEMTEKKQCQVIYTSHSPIFADVNQFESLRVVRQHAAGCRVDHVRKEDESGLAKARSAFKLGGRFDAGRNEVLFARRALLVEGFGDKIAALAIADKLQFDIDAEGLAVADCGGKPGIELFVRVCRALQIPFFVLHDDDIWPIDKSAPHEQQKKQEEENKNSEALNARIKAAVADDQRLFVVRPTLESVLEIGRDAKDKPRRVLDEVQKVDLQHFPEPLLPLLGAVEALQEEV